MTAPRPRSLPDALASPPGPPPPRHRALPPWSHQAGAGPPGTVAEALRLLLAGAMQGLELRHVLQPKAAPPPPAPAPPLLARAALGSPELSGLYAQLAAAARRVAAAAGARVEGAAPRGLYHVAIDCPGHGQSEGRRHELRDDPARLIATVVTSLGKTHALALVGGGAHGGAAVLRTLAPQPLLANFAVVCLTGAADAGGGPTAALAGLLQPTLVVARKDGGAECAAAGRGLRAAMPRATLLEPAGREFAPRTAARLLRLFQQHGWRAQMPDHGGEAKHLPRLTRQIGGLNAWHGAEEDAFSRETTQRSRKSAGELSERARPAYMV